MICILHPERILWSLCWFGQLYRFMYIATGRNILVILFRLATSFHKGHSGQNLNTLFHELSIMYCNQHEHYCHVLGNDFLLLSVTITIPETNFMTIILAPTWSNYCWCIDLKEILWSCFGADFLLVHLSTRVNIMVIVFVPTG